MGKAQIEEGYTKVANQLMEALAATDMNGACFRLCMVVMRLSYGYNQASRKISLADFANYSGIARKNISRYIKVLEDARIVIVERHEEREKPTYKMNTRVSQWKTTAPVIAPSLNSEGTPPVLSSEGTPSLSSEVVDSLSSEGTINKGINKDRKKPPKPPIEIPYQEIVDAYLLVASPHWPMVKGLNSNIKSQIKTRWTEDKERQNIHWWRWYFGFCKEHKFLREGSNRNGKAWRASLLWFLGVQNMGKVLSGYYAHDGETIQGEQSSASSAIHNLLGRAQHETMVDGNYQEAVGDTVIPLIEERTSS